MSMRAPVSDLPIVFDEVSVAAGAVTILDRDHRSRLQPARRPC